MTRQDATPVIHNGQTRIQVGVVAQHVLHDVVVEGVVLEQRVVRLEIDIGTILVLSVLSGIALQNAALESGATHLAVTIAGYLEMGTQRIDGLDTHTIQTYRLLEGLGVVLTTSIQYADRFDELTLRNATAIVTDRDTQVVVDSNLQTVASLHLEFVNRVVDDFFQQYINTVFWQ